MQLVAMNACCKVTAALVVCRCWKARWVIALVGWLSLMALPAPVLANASIALYVSPTTQAYFPTVGGNYDTMVVPWRKLLKDRRLPFRELNHPDELAGLGQSVLILPSAVALSPVERRALLRFRDAGGSILATWALGARDAGGKWLGHGYARELLGVNVVGEIGDDASTRFLLPYGDSPINRSVPAGRRIWMGKVAEKPLQLKGGIEAGAYTEWSRTVMKLDEPSAAIVFDEGVASGTPASRSSGNGAARPPDSGRKVMFGFSETAWDFQPADIKAIAADALRWLRRTPSAHLAAWPNGFRAAQIIEMDTEDGFSNAIHFANLMESVNAAGTFYCLTSEARKHADLVRRLAQHHEVGFHGEVHLGFERYSYEHQKRRLERMLAEMKDALGATDGWPNGMGRGFRAPTEGYDATTERLLQSMGLRHHLADPNSSNDRLPFFSPVATPDTATGLVVLPRGQLDDLNYMAMKPSPEQIGLALIGEYEFNLRMGGLGILSVHSQNFSDPAQLLPRPLHSSVMTRAVEMLTRHIGPRHERVWIAPAGKVADWWRERSHATVTARASEQRLDLELMVSGTAPVRGLTVLVNHPAGQATPVVRAKDASTPQPELRRIPHQGSALVFGAVMPGRHSYRITFP